MHFKDVPLLEEKTEKLNVHDFEPPYSRDPFRHDWLFPPDLPNPPPLRPVPLSRYKAAGLPAEEIESPRDIRYYPPDIPIPDLRLLKVLFSKNIFEALQKRNLPTIAAYRMPMEANIQRQIENEAIAKAEREFELFKQERYADITMPGKPWAHEAIMYQLANAEDINAFLQKLEGVNDVTV